MFSVQAKGPLRRGRKHMERERRVEASGDPEEVDKE